MTAAIVKIVDISTGEEIERAVNAQELAQIEADQKAQADRDKALAEKQAARQSALDKLAALGLSVEEISAITGA